MAKDIESLAEELVESTIDEVRKEREEKLRKEQEDESVEAIEELANTDFKGSNEEQGKMVEIMQGLAFADNDVATEFMNIMSDKATEAAQELDGEMDDVELEI